VDEPPSGWSLVARLPFGPGQDQLGYFPAHVDVGPGDEPNLAAIPTSFAVAADGSVWVLDAYKERVAHFAADGAYLGSVGHFPWASPWEPQDLAWSGDELLVLEWDGRTGGVRVTTLAGAEQSSPVRIVEGGRDASIDDFLPGAEGTVGLLRGHVGSLGDDRFWVAMDAPGGGEAEALPGIPLANGSFADVASEPGGDLVRVTFLREGQRAVLPIRIRVTDPAGEPLPTSVTPRPEAALPGGVVAFVRVVPSAAPAARRYGSDLWVLAVSNDGSALRWHRLPEPTIADEVQERHLTAGADGGLYLMVADDEGVRVYRSST
jgi:hypothetical protein